MAEMKLTDREIAQLDSWYGFEPVATDVCANYVNEEFALRDARYAKHNAERDADDYNEAKRDEYVAHGAAAYASGILEVVYGAYIDRDKLVNDTLDMWHEGARWHDVRKRIDVLDYVRYF